MNQDWNVIVEDLKRLKTDIEKIPVLRVSLTIVVVGVALALVYSLGKNMGEFIGILS